MKTKFQIYQIPNYQDYELHYSKDEQLIYNRKFKRYLKLNKRYDGYLQVGLSKNGKARTFKIHQIVWMCLKGDIPKDLQINHIDENKDNNCIENLELVTHLENMRHGTLQQRRAKAKSIPTIGIKKDLSEILHYPSAKEAERDKEKGFYQGAISACCNNKNKTHKDFIWFYQKDFEEYMNRFQGNLQDVIKYKSTLTK